MANHINNFDPIVVACATKRPVRFMAKEELFKNKLFGNILERVGAFEVKRDKNDRKSIKKAINILKENEVLGIFPEGTRSKDGEIGKGLPGATYIAIKSKAVVIPIGIVSNYKLFNPLFIKFGKPIESEVFNKEKVTTEEIIDITELMMEEIKKQIVKINENNVKPN